jgi:methyltransferase (TIGR00027 family)
MAAIARAIHLLHYGPRALLLDWLAWPLVGAEAEKMAGATPPVLGETKQPFMTWFAARARLAEDWLAASGARQYVILGAGLDSFAWRQSDGVEVFEVDEPSSQRWKQQRVAALGLAVPDELRWIPLNLERRQLNDPLRAAGLGYSQSVFVSWLGVIPYLTHEAIRDTLAQLPACQLAVAYVPPEEHWDAPARAIGRHFQAQVAELGEPWISLLAPEELEGLLAEAGFAVIEDLGAADIHDRYGLPSVHHERIALAQKLASGRR